MPVLFQTIAGVRIYNRADDARKESLEALEQLAAIKSERLRLTFYTSSANFSSVEALQYLDGFNTGDEVGIMGRMTFRQPVKNEIEAFSDAEEEFERRILERAEVDARAFACAKELDDAERNARDAAEVGTLIQLLFVLHRLVRTHPPDCVSAGRSPSQKGFRRGATTSS